MKLKQTFKQPLSNNKRVLWGSRGRFFQKSPLAARGKKGFLFMVIILTVVLFLPLSASVDLDNFKEMIILENGRKKPMDTYARDMLMLFSGRSSYQNYPAIEWLAKVIFNPPGTYEDRVFLVNHTEAADALGIVSTGKARDRFSYAQLIEHLPRLQQLAMAYYKKPENQRLAVEEEIILLYNKIYIYQQLTMSLSFSFPGQAIEIPDAEVRTFLGISGQVRQISFYSFIQSGAVGKLSSLNQELKNKDQSQWTPQEVALESIYRQVTLQMNRTNSLPFTIFPVMVNQEEKWVSPWDVLWGLNESQRGFQDELGWLDAAAVAYRANDSQGFSQALHSFNQSILKRLPGVINAKRIGLEVFYNQLDPFFKAQILYGISGLSLLLLFISSLSWQKWLYRFSIFLLLAGFVPHTAGIIIRMLIRHRPPVTNLYETFIFAAWMVVLLGIILEFFKKKNIGVMTGSFSGFLLLLVAGKYAIKGDTMGMLVAVLDSNFWLATHVITITVGFAGIALSGVIGHLYILQRIFKPQDKELLKNTFQAIYATQAFGLVFTFTGTILGGIWADQSWGRFWGWDPKENGALLVILWSAILFHARLAKMVKETGFAFGSIGGIIAVALAWFGVNLLNVGLHTYGFTSGVARALFIFLAVELFFIFLSTLFLKPER